MTTTTPAIMVCEPKICQVGGGGYVLPLGGDAEQEWPNGLRIVLYMLGLFWSFMGVATVSDVFMGAIEKVTSVRKRVFSKKKGKHVTVKVWNDTVANLTLMALGSSAPEILLNVIEVCLGDFYAGELGPSTIVGSAAFNLLVISAVCVIAIGDVPKQIDDMTVFGITCSFSILAYIWLFVIVSITSPNVIEVWEALVTFFLFPLLVALAYMADRGYFSKRETNERIVSFDPEDIDKEELAAMQIAVIKKHGPELTAEEISLHIEREFGPPISRAQRRVEATKAMSGGSSKHREGTNDKTVTPAEGCEDEAANKILSKIVFEKTYTSVPENIGTMQIKVMRTGDLSTVATVAYKTVEGTAKATEDYTHVEGDLVFAANEAEKSVDVTLVDDEGFEFDEEFTIELSNLRIGGSPNEAHIIETATATVRIIDDDDPGQLGFENGDELEVMEDISEKVELIKLRRTCGVRGILKVAYRTENDSAIAGKDFVAAEGEVELADGQCEQSIEIKICPQGRYESNDKFRLILSSVSSVPEGARLDPNGDGGPNENICTITIKSDSASNKKTDNVLALLGKMSEKNSIGTANYADQFKAAIKVNGGMDPEDEDYAPPTKMDYVMHVISVPWKLLFALIPPTDYCNGWLCFNVALAFIGIVTMFIGDLAGLLGCTLGIPNSITAITFVALGTSLPDTFASMAAAEQDSNADASIGNVTGSNSVNVFLGLGMPWSIGAIAWAVKGKDPEWFIKYPDVALDYPEGGLFVVKGGALGFSVGIFTACACTCVAILMLRRKLVGGELGGPKGPKIASAVAMIGLWLTYIAISSWKALEMKGPCA